MPCEMSAHYFVCHVCTCFLGLARTLCIRCMYGIFGREITRYTVICGAYIWFWPTLIFLCATSAQNFLCHVYTCFCVPCLHMFLYATSAHYVRHISLVCGTSVACLHVCTFCVPCLHMFLCAMFTHVLCAMSAHVFMCHVCTLCEARQPGLWHICGMSARLHILRAMTAHVLVCHIVDACMNYACMMYGDSICKTIETCVYRDVPLPVFH